MSGRTRGKNRVKQRYVCSRCEESQMIPVHPTDADRSIRYSCDTCRDVTSHDPAGKTDWY